MENVGWWICETLVCGRGNGVVGEVGEKFGGFGESHGRVGEDGVE